MPKMTFRELLDELSAYAIENDVRITVKVRPHNKKAPKLPGHHDIDMNNPKYRFTASSK